MATEGTEAKLTLNIEGFREGLKQAEKANTQTMDKVEKSTKKATDNLNEMGKTAQDVTTIAKNGFSGLTSVLVKSGSSMANFALAGAAVVAVLGLVGKTISSAFKYVANLATGIRDLTKQAAAVKLSTNAFVALEHACYKTGVGMQNMFAIMNKIDYAMTQALDGNQKYVSAFNALNLSFEELSKMTPEKSLMKIVEAMNEIKATGGHMPRELYSIFGRRDMQTLNKLTAAEKDFNKYLAEAEALGLHFSEETIKASVEYAETAAESVKRMEAMAAGMKTVLGMTETMKSLWENIAESITNASGKVNKLYSDDFVGIGNEAERLMKNGGEGLSSYRKKQLVTAAFMDPDAFGLTLQNSITHYLRKIEEMTEEELTEAIKKIYGKYDITQLAKPYKEMLFRAVQEIDDRFNANDPSTWVQRRIKPTEELQAALTKASKTKIDAKAADLNNQLIKSAEYYEKLNNKAGKLVDIEDEILKLDQEMAKATRGKITALDEELKYQLRMNSAIANRNALENETKGINDARRKMNQRGIGTILSKYDLDSSVINQFMDSASKVRGDKFNPMNDVLMNQLKLQHAAIYNPRMRYEQDAEYIERLKKSPRYRNSEYATPQKFMRNNSYEFWKSMEGAAKQINEGNIDFSVGQEQLEKIKRTMELYNEYAKKYKAEPISLDLDIKHSDAATYSKNYDKVEEALKGFLEKEKDMALESKEIVLQYEAIQKRLQQFQSVHNTIVKQLQSGRPTEQEAKMLQKDLYDNTTEWSRFQNSNETRATIAKYEQTIQGMTARQKEIEAGYGNDKAKYEKDINWQKYDAKLKEVKTASTEIERGLREASQAFNLSKIIDAVNKMNEDAKMVKEISTKQKAMDQVENDTGLQYRLIKAELAGQTDIVEKLKDKIALHKLGVAVNEENLKIYKDELELIKFTNKELETQKNLKTLDTKNKQTEVDNEAKLAKYRKDWGMLRVQNQRKTLQGMNLEANPENFERYKDALDKNSDYSQKQRNISYLVKTGDEMQKTIYEAMTKQGKGLKVARMKMKDEAEKALERPLTDEENGLLKRLATLQYRLKEWKMPEQPKDTIYSNDLAKRGGFNASVKVQRDDVSKQQLASIKQLQSIVSKISETEEKLAKTLAE